MAICHNGPHVGSTSRAVETRDIFGGMSFITIIDIPFEIHEERFMYSHLFNSFVTDRIKYLDCCIKLCGDGNEYDLKTQFCDDLSGKIAAYDTSDRFVGHLWVLKLDAKGYKKSDVGFDIVSVTTFFSFWNDF